MDGRCPGAVPLGPARLPGYRLRFCWDSPGWGGGVADVQHGDGDDDVWGVLWEMSDEHVATLDDYESVDDGVYGKRTVTVEHEGRSVDAYLYIMAPDRAEKSPSARYLNALVRGAKAYGVPDEYIERLRARAGHRAPGGVIG